MKIINVIIDFYKPTAVPHLYSINFRRAYSQDVRCTYVISSNNQ